MEKMRCRRPEMARKALWAYLLAYTLIRLLMAQAALMAGQKKGRLNGISDHKAAIEEGAALRIPPVRPDQRDAAARCLILGPWRLEVGLENE